MLILINQTILKLLQKVIEAFLLESFLFFKLRFSKLYFYPIIKSSLLQIFLIKRMKFVIQMRSHQINNSITFMGICQHANKDKDRQQNAIPLTNMQKKQMKRPHMVKACPIDVTLEEGKEYLYCACGLSKSQPFCDGSHVGTGFQPLKFTAAQKRCFLCLCKRTRNPPYCDNTHKRKNLLDF